MPERGQPDRVEDGRPSAPRGSTPGRHLATPRCCLRYLVRPRSTAQQEIHPTTHVEALGWRHQILPRRCARRPPRRWGGWSRQAAEVAPALLATMKDEMPEVRVLSATALGRVARATKVIEAAQALQETLTSTSRARLGPGIDGGRSPQAAARS